MRLEAKTGAFPTGAVLGGGGLVAGTAVRVLRLDHLPWPLCTFRAITGLPCLTCGSTRAFGRLAAFDLRAAFLFQPLVTSLALLVLLWALVDLALLVRGRALVFRCSGREARWLGLGLLILALANWGYLVATLG
jgi:hypothetical protein